MSLTEYTDEQLEKELARRKAFAKIKPHFVEQPNPDSVKEACKSYIEFLYSEDYNEDELDDYQNQIFETALQMVYGYEVWDYVNEIVST